MRHIPRRPPIAASTPQVSGVGAVNAPTSGSLRFYGNNNGAGTTAIDRVVILANETSHTANVGSALSTVELWLRCAAGNNSSGMTPGANYNAIEGNIFLDRDRFDLPQSWVMSLDAGRPVIGINMSGTDLTARCATDIRDDEWHFLRWCRNATSGEIWFYVDETLEINTTGPTGDLSCPNTGGGATWDPYLVLGAEKHDADVANYPSFFGWMTELRISNSLRSTTPTITVPTAPFTVDGNTRSLYRFTDSGTTLTDVAGNCNGTIRRGGTANGPTWEAENPF